MPHYTSMVSVSNTTDTSNNLYNISTTGNMIVTGSAVFAPAGGTFTIAGAGTGWKITIKHQIANDLMKIGDLQIGVLIRNENNDIGIITKFVFIHYENRRAVYKVFSDNKYENWTFEEKYPR